MVGAKLLSLSPCTSMMVISVDAGASTFNVWIILDQKVCLESAKRESVCTTGEYASARTQNTMSKTPSSRPFSLHTDRSSPPARSPSLPWIRRNTIAR